MKAEEKVMLSKWKFGGHELVGMMGIGQRLGMMI